MKAVTSLLGTPLPEWQSIPVFSPGEFHGWKNLVGYSPWDHKGSDMTEPLTHTLPRDSRPLWAIRPLPLLWPHLYAPTHPTGSWTLTAPLPQTAPSGPLGAVPSTQDTLPDPLPVTSYPQASLPQEAVYRPIPRPRGPLSLLQQLWFQCRIYLELYYLFYIVS